MFALQQEQIALLLQNSVAVFKLDDQTLHRLVEPLLRAVPELRDANAAYNQLHKPVPTTCWDKPGCPTPQFVLGGFGGTGEPSLFHAPSIRQIRAAAYATMFPQFAEAFPDRKLEVLFDRFGIRRNGLKVDKEEWHRDVATQIKDGDIIYGGWINLDPPMQADNKTKTKPQIFFRVLSREFTVVAMAGFHECVRLAGLQAPWVARQAPTASSWAESSSHRSSKCRNSSFTDFNRRPSSAISEGRTAVLRWDSTAAPSPLSTFIFNST